MTSHELAQTLLDLPDRPIVIFDGCCATVRVTGARIPISEDFRVILAGCEADDNIVILGDTP